MDKTYEFSFENECAMLAGLETFEPGAFSGDNKVPQSLCNLVLTLALIFNDMRDLYYASVLVGDCKPKLVQKTRQVGNYLGLNLHVTRLMMSCLHELLNLISKQREDVEHEFFREVVKGLPRHRRNEWQEVVRAALGESSGDEKLGKFLLRIRNNVSFHYDVKAIQIGFKNHFFDERLDTRAYVSRGSSIQSSRFYFVDAAVQGLLREVAGEQPDNITEPFKKLLSTVCNPLILIVVGFIQKRKFAFRPEN